MARVKKCCSVFAMSKLNSGISSSTSCYLPIEKHPGRLQGLHHSSYFMEEQYEDQSKFYKSCEQEKRKSNVKTYHQYVFELQERLDSSMKIFRENLLKI